MSTEPPLLAIEALTIAFAGAGGETRAVEAVSLALGRGRSLGLVGESGAGKSQLALAVPGLTPRGARVAGSIRFDGEELIGAPAATLRRLRGARIGTVFQDPAAALAPHLTIGTQLGEVLAAHALGRGRAARRAALAMLERVRVPDAAARLGQYPHELSGGLKQRVMLAIALIGRPALVVADEPTTALDVTVEAGILELLAELVRAEGTALLLVSHDLAVVAGLCDEIAVLYAGRVVEQGPARAVLAAPAHPYTAGLLAARLTLDSPLDAPVPAIPGGAPGAGPRPPGCGFAPRCRRAQARCRAAPPPLAAQGAARVACYLPLAAGEAP
ncbi:MAG TPA: ABC transporter ATP-binding protein [Steroidobacteraceae bacterium]|nr:ABC transporter ATP-binding protein [Steroidobacteraceae bacterium]